MYRCEMTGDKIFEAANDLVNEEISFVKEDDDFYYVRIKEEYNMSDSIWQVSKATKEVYFMEFLYFRSEVNKFTKKADAAEFKEWAKS